MKPWLVRLFLLLLVVAKQASCFVPISVARPQFTSFTPIKNVNARLPPAVHRQRQSVAGVQTMGLFGLGAPEIVIILVAAAFLLGPEKLAELGKDAGKMATELKEVPKEFQKGLEEGEIEARSKKAKVIKKLPKESKEGEE